MPIIMRRLAAAILLVRRILGRKAASEFDVFGARDGEGGDDIRVTLALMPLFVREAYLLRTVDRLSHGAIARRLGISNREVRRLLRRAVRTLDLRARGRRAGP